MSNKPLILFVDDEPQALKYFGKSVEDSYNVITALNASDARSLLNDQHEDITVLISDQRMPTETGVQLLEYTRVTYPGIVRLLTTAYSDLSSAIDAVNTGGIYWYVSKPWNGQELKSILKRSVEYYYLQRDREQLMKSKGNVFQHILLSDRTKSLLLLTNQLKSRGWLRTDESLDAYLATARSMAKLTWSINDTLALDLRDIAERECLFLMSVNEAINQLPPTNTSINKQCDLSAIVSNVLADITQSQEFEDVQFHFEEKQPELIESDEALLKSLFRNIVTRIANMDGVRLDLSVKMMQSPNAGGVQIAFFPQGRTWSPSQLASLFSAGVPSLGGFIGVDMDMLPSYFIAGQLGGNIRVNTDNKQNDLISIELPKTQPTQRESLDTQLHIKKVYDELENWIDHVAVEIED